MKEIILKVIKTPLVYAFIVLYIGAAITQSNYKENVGVESLFTFILFFCVLTSIMFLITKNIDTNIIVIQGRKKEVLLSLGYILLWLVVFMVFGKYLLANKFLSVGIGFWGLLVVLPLLYLLKKGYGLSDFGLTKKHFLKNVKVSLLACVVVGGLLLLITPGGKFILSSSLSFEKLIISFVISFGYSLVFAAFFEEFFFRGILQTRLTQYFNSGIKGILITSIIFGLYHLPFQYYNVGAENADLVHSFSNVLKEHMISAPIFGILWYRTRSLMAPITLHALIDAISLLPQIADKYYP
jgi:membrane protease YdiL (CAAX protease family)